MYPLDFVAALINNQANHLKHSICKSCHNNVFTFVFLQQLAGRPECIHLLIDWGGIDYEDLQNTSKSRHLMPF